MPPPSRTTSYAANPGAPPDDDDPLLAFAPVIHKQKKRNCVGPERQRKFIAALAASGIVSAAARAIGATPEALYGLRRKAGAEEFCAAWDKAVDLAISRVEDGALARAIEGVEKPIVSGGQLLGWHRVHNEALTIFLLRSRRSQRYGAVPVQALKPGHPLYEKIRQEVIDEYDGDEAAVRASIDRFLEDMRDRRLANEKILAEQDAQQTKENSPGEPGE